MKTFLFAHPLTSWRCPPPSRQLWLCASLLLGGQVACHSASHHSASNGNTTVSPAAGAGSDATGTAATTTQPTTDANATAAASAAAAADAAAEAMYSDGRALPSDGNLDFGSNVLIFDPSMSSTSIQTQLDAVFERQQNNQFGSDRYAYFFKPGNYSNDVQIGFYTTVHGLGVSPDDVHITGAVRSTALWNNNNATQNFWRGAENLATTPTMDAIFGDPVANLWAVSQATQFRRIHSLGDVRLWQPAAGIAWASGGFIADCKFDTRVESGSQQQFFTRNSKLTSWQDSVWNQVFLGDVDAPGNGWPTSPNTLANGAFTTIAQTPSMREKPYLSISTAGAYSVNVPTLLTNTQGPSWANGPTPVTTLPITSFYVAHPDKDTAVTLNVALQRGKHLLFTPGVYELTSPLRVTSPNTILLGIGVATLAPTAGNLAISVSDVDGVSIAGLLLDAGTYASPTLVQVGDATSTTRHSSNPTVVYDTSCRVGGARAGTAKSCMVINSSDAILDNVWLWRADHGSGFGWDINKAANGLIVNGAHMTAYGLFVEHFQEYQTVWNGDFGRTFFYQSEIPYDVPDQASWMAGSTLGWASYKVASTVTSHQAYGMGVYAYLFNPVVLENAIETPTGSGIELTHMTTQWFLNNPNSRINHIYNGIGLAVDANLSGAWSAN